MAETTVLLDIDADGVALITLNQPDQRNAWSLAMEQRFYELLHLVDHDPAVRVAVLTGAGRTFCPGASTARLGELAGVGVDYTGRPPLRKTLAFRKPLIAAINGGCAGIGLIQAAMCDVRFAAAGAKLATSFARRGLPAEHGLSWLLPRLIGLENAMDLLLSARVITAEQALSIGLVRRVVALDELLPAALAYARDIAANCSPTAMALIKQQVLTDLDSQYGDAYERSCRLTEAVSAGSDFREGVDAFINKRPPQFPGLDA